jgi:protease IV
MFKKFTKFLLFLLLSVVLFIGVIVLVLALTMGPQVKENSILVLALEGPLMEVGPQGWKEQVLFGEVITTRDIITSLRKAKSDSRIKALWVSSMFSGMGIGKAQEVRAAIQDFAKSKKPVYGLIEGGDALDYYVCAASQKLYMTPDGEGGASLMGLRSEVPFFKGTLDKLGIVAQFDHIGAYKSGSDVYTRDSMSEAHREATISLLDSLYDRITGDIAKDRKMTPERIQELINEGPLVRKMAKEKGLVDQLMYRDEVEDRMKKELKLSTLNQVSVLDYSQPTFSEAYGEKKNKIAIVYGIGTIVPGESSRGFGDDMMGSTTVTKAIRQAREENSVKAIVFRVDSPGGSAAASDLIWREVKITTKKKPVIISMADVAASGGYYVSMGASKIIADPSTITGSIGVYFGKFYAKGLYDKIGLNKEIIKRGDHADLYSDYVPFSEGEWEIVRGELRSIYDAFTRKAAEGRKKTQQEIDAIGQGRVWTGDQALQRGLVDQLGGLQDAIQEAKKLAKLSDKEEVGLTIYPARKEALSSLFSGTDTQLQLPEDLRKLMTWARIAEREHVLLLMPYKIAIN